MVALRDEVVEGVWLADKLEGAAVKAGHDGVALAECLRLCCCCLTTTD